MMKSKYILLIISLLYFSAKAQYTDIINSNQPGHSQSAYAVGPRVLQFEGGLWYENRSHQKLFTDTNFIGLNYAVRYGFLTEKLEAMLSGTAIFANTHYYRFTDEYSKFFGFLENTIGAKYLIFSPKADEKPNLYSWKANNSFNWRRLIPAVSVYAGMNFFPAERFFYEGIDKFSPKVVVSLQSHPMPRLVFVGNIIANRFLSQYREWGYIATLTHNLDNGRFSIFLESEGILSEYYSDSLMRLGGAYLFTKDIQVNIDLGTSWKTTPSRYMALLGFSYRLDNHASFVKKKTATKDEPATKIDRKKKPKKSKKWLLF